MSKSYGNTITLSESADAIRAAAQKMFTDPTRIKMADPGHPETCNVCGYWKMFEPSQAAKMWDECRTSTRGCAQNKQELAEVLVRMTEPFRKARESGASGAAIERLLQDGAAKARAVARQTLHEVRQAFGLA